MFYYKKNRFQQLKGFYYTALLGSPTKAAEKMELSQSAVSIQIKSLEADLKTSLFTRKNKKFVLTQDGEFLYQHATKHIQGLEGLLDTFIAERKLKNENKIRIGANHVSISYLLPRFIKQYQDLHPKIRYEVRNLGKADALERLLEGHLDFLIFPYEENDIPEECNFFPLVNYQPILLVKKDHPLTKIKNVSMSDMSNYNLVRIDPDLITLPSFEEVIKRHKLKTNVEFEMGDWEILKRFIEADIGFSIVSSICSNNEPNLVAIPLMNYFPEMTYGLLTKKGVYHGDIQTDFINLIKEYYKK